MEVSEATARVIRLESLRGVFGARGVEGGEIQFWRFSGSMPEAVFGAQADLERGLDVLKGVRAGLQCGSATGLSPYFA